MTKGVGTLLAVCSLLLAGEASAEVNYALLQPAYQLGIHPLILAGTPDKAVDGNLGQVLSTQCITTTLNTVDAISFPPWWVVRLSRWILPTAVHIYNRNDLTGGGYSYDAGDTFSIGPFWDDSLSRVVPANLLSSDPVGGGRFFFLRSQGITLFTLAGSNQRFPISTRTSGRYFAIQSPDMGHVVDVCEVLVFGSANLLYGMMPTERFGSVSPRVNLSMLTDESATTCWDALLPTRNFDSIIDFIPIVNLTTNFTVAVLTAGTVRPKVSDDGTCTPWVYLTITTSEDRICSFVQSVADGGKNYLSFACTCTACTGIGVSLVRRGAFAGSASLCEVVAFNG